MREIPDWLSHLRADRRGLPVPYVNRWGLDEDDDLLTINYDENVRRLAVFYDDSQEPVPNFTAQNMQRQRECVMQGLCQVCRRPVPYSRRCVVISSISVETVNVAGQDRAVIFEPWLCTRCALFAVDRCPALIRRKETEDLTVFPIRRPSDFQVTVSLGWVEGPLEAQSRETPPAMWAKIILDPSVVRISAKE
jgi:hypothetical protein